MTGIDQSKYRNSSLFTFSKKRNLNIWVKEKYLGGGTFGKVMYMYIILKVYFRIH